MNKKKINFIDIFCGAGGKSLGFEEAGYSPIIAIDHDINALNTYKINRKTYKNLTVIKEDISNMSERVKKIIEKKLSQNNVELVVGGPPCQGFSRANKQNIINDPRNVLYKHFVEFVRKSVPKIFVMENVRGILKLSDQIITNFNEIGYKTEYILIDSSEYNVPQKRSRVFFIGTRKDLKIGPNKILDILKNKKSPKKFYLKDAIIDLPKLSARTQKNSYQIENEDLGFEKVLKKNINNQNKEYLEIINFGKNVRYIYNHKSRYNNKRDIEIFRRLPQGGCSTHESIKDIMPYNNRNHIFKDKYYKLKYDSFSRTITAHMKFDCNMYIHPEQARGLTPREAARIQTFPDWYVFKGKFTTWYKQIGNAVPCQVAFKIAQSIKESGALNNV